jgi:hypothetical protein
MSLFLRNLRSIPSCTFASLTRLPDQSWSLILQMAYPGLRDVDEPDQPRSNLCADVRRTGVERDHGQDQEPEDELLAFEAQPDARSSTT